MLLMGASVLVLRRPSTNQPSRSQQRSQFQEEIQTSGTDTAVNRSGKVEYPRLSKKGAGGPTARGINKAVRRGVHSSYTGA